MTRRGLTHMGVSHLDIEVYASSVGAIAVKKFPVEARVPRRLLTAGISAFGSSVSADLFVVYCLLNVPSTRNVYFSDRSAPTFVQAGTLRKKLQIKLCISPSHNILTLDRPVPTLTL